MAHKTLLYVPHLTIDDVERHIVEFTFNAPPDSIGVELSATLLNPTLNIARGLSAWFEITKGERTVALIENGFVRGRAKATQNTPSPSGRAAPADNQRVVCRDRFGEKFNLAPRPPVIIYDPAIVELAEGENDSQINDEEGNRILAETRAITALDLYQVLNFAYIEGCGFEQIITNLPNYDLPRADFPIEASYHEVVSQFYGQRRPVVYGVAGKLFIVDVRAPLPEGMTASVRNLDTDKFISLNQEKPNLDVVNAILVTQNETGNIQSIKEELPGGVSQRIEQDPTESGSIIDGNYQRIVVMRYVAQLHEDAANPSRVTNEVVWRIETRETGLDDLGVLRELRFEQQTDLYDYSFRRKIGYNRIINQYTNLPGGLAAMRQTLFESNAVGWTPTGKPGEFRKIWTSTQKSGLVIIEGEGDDATKTPLFEADRFRTVPQEGTVEEMPILGRIEYFRETGPDQVEVLVQEKDHLTGRTLPGKPTQHTGTIRINILSGENRPQKRFLIRDTESEELDGPRKPISWDAGFLPFDQAKELGARMLKDAQLPPEQFQCVLMTLDFGIRRGSIRRVFDRAGNNKLMIVLGYSIKGEVRNGLCVMSMVIQGVAIG